MDLCAHNVHTKVRGRLTVLVSTRLYLGSDSIREVARAIQHVGVVSLGAAERMTMTILRETRTRFEQVVGAIDRKSTRLCFGGPQKTRTRGLRSWWPSAKGDIGTPDCLKLCLIQDHADTRVERGREQPAPSCKSGTRCTPSPHRGLGCASCLGSRYPFVLLYQSLTLLNLHVDF